MLLEMFLIWSDVPHIEARRTCWTIDKAEIHLNTVPFSQNFRPKTWGKTVPKTECNQQVPGKGFHLLSKFGFFIYFHPKLAAEKLSIPFNYHLAKGAKQQANGSYDSVRRKRAWKLGKAVGNAKSQSCFDKIRKISRFCQKIGRKKIGEKREQATQPHCVQSIIGKKPAHF